MLHTFLTFVKFTWHGNRHSTGLQGTSARAMASICVHRATRTPPDSTPGHIRSRDGINLCPSSDPNPSKQHSKAHPLARWFSGIRPTGHAQPCRHCIPLSCNSSDKAITFLRAYRAHPLARWHRFVSIEHREPLQTSLQGTSARAMVCRKIIDRQHTAVRARLVTG